MSYDSSSSDLLIKSITTLSKSHANLLNSFSQLRHKISKFRLADAGVLFNVSQIEVIDNDTSFHLHFASRTFIFKYDICANSKQHLDAQPYIGSVMVSLKHPIDGRLINVVPSKQPFILFSSLEDTYVIHDDVNQKGYREVNFDQFMLSFIDIVLTHIESV